MTYAGWKGGETRGSREGIDQSQSVPLPTFGSAASSDAAAFAPAVHDHDTRYYTEGEVNTLLAGKAGVIAPSSAITDDASGAVNQAKVNAILAVLRAHGIIAP